MAENEHSAASSVYSVQQRPPLNLLLLAGADENWTRAVQDLAGLMGDVALQQTYSVNEAMSCLVLGDPNYSHFLVASELAGDRIGELAKLTAGESHGVTNLVLLGADRAPPPRSQFVPEADLESLTRAIIAGEGTPRPTTPPLALEELDAALAGAQLHTRYQPIVRLSDHRPVGLEVLARLDHPTHGTLPPDHFVPQMERAGLSRRLTEGVIERAFADHVTHLAGLGLWLALNFPLDVLMDEPALIWLEERRLAHAIPAARIVIELTESRPVDALDAAGLSMLQRSIGRLRSLGYGLAIDDVGPAVKNHTALFGLDFTAAKLDKGLVSAAAAGDADAQVFLLDTVTMGHRAGMTVVAEGVKDEATWDRMREAGADQAQGYFVARPLPAAAVPVWSEAWQGRLH